ncbi:MAG: pilus assembly protein [Acidimicrobiia bacterium]|nr:pilus assembly protein [Acidimicrobiia bacterium]
MSPRNCPESRLDRGQATVEFALTIPVLVIALLGAIQVFVILVDRIHLVHVTRDAARAASVGDDPRSAAEMVIDRSFPDREISLTVSMSDDVVTVEMVLSNPTDVPIIGRFLPDVELRESLSMLAETFVDQ